MAITNERQYRVTLGAIHRFEDALGSVDAENQDLDVILASAIREGIQGEIVTLKQQIADYQARKRRSGPFRIVSLDDIPDVLINARIAKGLSQRELAERLGMKPQQVQRYEACRYAQASLARVQQVAKCLDVRIGHGPQRPRQGTHIKVAGKVKSARSAQRSGAAGAERV